MLREFLKIVGKFYSAARETLFNAIFFNQFR